MVRLVVLNYNGGNEVAECVDSLAALDWPVERREIVVVDNASHDGSPERVVERGHAVQLIRNPENTGFSANNLALGDLDDVDFVGLVNPDATVEPGWLRALVDAMTHDDIGAVSPLMLLASRLVEVDADAAGLCGYRLHGVEIDDRDVLVASRRLWRLLPDGGNSERDGPMVIGSTVPLALDIGHRLGRIRLHVSSDRTSEPRWVDVTATGPPRDVVNNAGIELRPHGYGADRGLGDTDLTKYEDLVEVFGWSGGGALLRAAYLADVGPFDPLFFLYYEDLDLSWRGRSRGWRHVFVPGAVMRHHHASSTVEGSPLFVFQTELNRLVTVLTNAPAGFALVALARFLVASLGYLRADVLVPLVSGRRPSWTFLGPRTRVVGRVVRMTPQLVGRRRRLARLRTVDPHRMLDWIVDPG